MHTRYEANPFAREAHIDDVAHAVKMDPLEFRLKSLKDARLWAVLQLGYIKSSA